MKKAMQDLFICFLIAASIFLFFECQKCFGLEIEVTRNGYNNKYELVGEMVKLLICVPIVLH